MPTAVFSATGGQLEARVTRGFAAPGTYNLYLYEQDKVTLVQKWEQIEFSTPENNTHPLPEPASANDRRWLYLVAIVGLIPPGNEYNVRLVVLQDGSELTDDCGKSDTGTPPTQEVQCTLQLVAAAAQQAAEGGGI